MTAYALRLENATDTAARVRLGDLLGLTPAGALTARTGIRAAPTAGDVAVSDGTMQVTVQPFVAWIQGGISTEQGGYPFVSDDVETLLLANGDPTLARVDTIAAVVNDDPYDGSGLLDAAVEVVQGTPGGGAPALPDNCLPLFDVNVPAGADVGSGGLTGSDLGADRRTYVSGLGGVVPVASQAERDALPATDSTVVYRGDLDRFEALAGGAWQVLPSYVEDPWHTVGSGGEPAFEGSWVNFGGAYNVAQFRKVGDEVQVRGLIKSGATDTSPFTLPAGYRPPADLRFTIDASGAHGVAEVRTSGAIVLVMASSAFVQINLTFSTT